MTPRRRKMSRSSRTGNRKALKVLWLLNYVVNMLTSWQRLFPLATFHKHHCMLSFWKHSQPASTWKVSALFPVQLTSFYTLLTDILLWIWHLRMPCTLRSVLFHTRRGHLASKLVSCRGRSVPVTKQMTIVGKPALVCSPWYGLIWWNDAY